GPGTAAVGAGHFAEGARRGQLYPAELGVDAQHVVLPGDVMAAEDGFGGAVRVAQRLEARARRVRQRVLVPRGHAPGAAAQAHVSLASEETRRRSLAEVGGGGSL